MDALDDSLCAISGESDPTTIRVLLWFGGVHLHNLLAVAFAPFKATFSALGARKAKLATT